MTINIARLPAFSLGELVRINRRADTTKEWVVLFRSWAKLLM
jgi:hypothetical protein